VAAGSSITTTPLRTLPFPFRNFYPRKNSRGTPSPYSPDLAPCDFFLFPIFPRIKIILKGIKFDDVDSIKMNATTELNSISREEFQRCFQKWQERWEKSRSSAGDYFEGDN
jgi:hypothetical protein